MGQDQKMRFSILFFITISIVYCEPISQIKFVSANAGLNMRTKPDKRSDIILLIPFSSAVKIIKNSQLKIYKGAPHGLCSTHKDEVNADLLAFIRSSGVRSS